MKKFFNIQENYRFEWNDIRAVATIANVILIMMFGLKIAWFGLFLAVVGIIKNYKGDRHINSYIMYVANIVLNVYFSRWQSLIVYLAVVNSAVNLSLY